MPDLANVIVLYARLRTLVAYLGEKAQLRWWDTGYLGETGRAFLSINFPRSTLAAGVSAAGSAAKRLHDERIGRSRVFHLFRLPFEIETQVQEAILRADQGTLWALIPSREAALSVLGSLAGATLVAPEGPVCVGEERHILTPDGVGESARHYLSAFSRGVVCLPYFMAENPSGRVKRS